MAGPSGKRSDIENIVMIRYYKYRIYPNAKQKEILSETLNLCCWLYNAALQQRIDIYRQYKRNVNYYYQQNELPNCKKEISELLQIDAMVLQNTIRRVDRTFNNFFRRIQQEKEKAGFPRFKSRDRYNSFTYPTSTQGFKLVKGKLRLSKIGDLKIKLHREIPEKIKICTVKKDIDRWYACFVVEEEPKILIKTGTQIGIDVGITNFAVLSNGEVIENPKFLSKSQKKLKRKQKRLSKKIKDSKNRNKKRILVAKQHRKIREQRKDFQHKVSRKLVNEYDLIVFEDLQISNMLKNHYLAKSISDCAWGQFIDFVSYKAEEAGKIIEFVDPRNTSILCSSCREKVPKTLADRIHCCPKCGLEIDRDLNAAINILNKNTVGTTEFKAWEDAGILTNSMNQEYPMILIG